MFDDAVVDKSFDVVIVGDKTREEANVRGIDLDFKQISRVSKLLLSLVEFTGVFFHLFRFLVTPNVVHVATRKPRHESDLPWAIVSAEDLGLDFFH